MSRAWAELAADDPAKAAILLRGIPFDGAASAGKGAACAPDRIRQLSSVLPPVTEGGIVMDGFSIHDDGDFEVSLDWADYFRRIEEGAARMMETGRFCLFIGGDHSVTIPLHRAFCHVNNGRRIGTIHFDSHSDILDRYEGHPWSHACTERRFLENPGVGPAALALVGIRSWEAEEVRFLGEHPKIALFTAARVEEIGMGSVISSLRERFAGYDALYLTLDIDVLDPAYAPGTGTPEAGGLTTRQMMGAVRELVKSLPVTAMDLVEVSPPLDSSDITSWAALKILYEVFGQVFLKNRKP